MKAFAATRRHAAVLGGVARTIVREPRLSALSARMAFWLALVSAAARLTSLTRAQQLVAGRMRTARSRAANYTPEELARAIDRVLQFDLPMFRPRCWKRAMVLCRYLDIAGFECRINFGVRRDAQGALVGHAWLDRQGQPFLESDAGIYVVTFSLPCSRDAVREAG